MTGQLRFRLDNEITSSGNPDRARDLFTHMLNYFEDHPNFSRVASYYGVNGTGFGFSNASDESGENAWAIYRSSNSSPNFDVAIRWSWSSFSTPNVSGSWQAGASNFGPSLAVAAHSSSAAWAGTANDNGQDSFANSNPWKSGSLVWPRQNMVGGSEETEQRYTGIIDTSLGSGTGRLHIAGDDTGFVVAWDDTDNGSFDSLIVFERYISFVSGANTPFFFYSAESSNNMIQNTSLGGLVDNNNLNGSISVSIDGTNEDHGFNSGSFSARTAYQNLYIAPVPMTASADDPIREWPIIVGSDDTMSIGSFGAFGHLNLVRNSYQSLTASDLLRSGSDDQRLVIRTSTLTHPTLTMPWTASVSPPAGTFYSNATVFMTESIGFTAVTSSNADQFALGAFAETGGGGAETVTIFRGENPPGTFVYSEGTPPVGAVNVIIVGFK